MTAQANGHHKDPREFWLASVQSRLAHIQDVRPLQTNSVVGALETLDNELAAVHLAMCSLRTRRNALLPISSLPPEVLARIFHFYSVAEPPPYRRPPQIGWIIVTHVCRAWRDTALQQPYLWSEATTGLGPKWLERMLARAKMVPVSISYFIDLKQHDFVSKYLSHVRRIGLCGTASQLTQALTPPADVLEHLEITPSYYSRATCLPVDLCSGHAPYLRRVILSDIMIPWSAPIFCNLTDLQIRIDPDFALFRGERVQDELSPDIGGFQQLLGTLEKMPALKRLVLEHCLPSGSSNLSNRHVALPQLENLSLAGTLAQCSNVVRNLVISPSCQIRLKCDERGSQQQIADIVRFVAVHANAGNPFLVLSISADSGLYCIEAWRSYSPPVLGHWFLRDDAPQADPDISVSLIRTDFEVLCAGLPFNDIRNLSIHLPDDPASQTWIELFGRCKSIEHLSVGEGPTATSLVRALIGQGTAPGSLMPIMDISNTIRSLELRDVRNIDEETRMRICVAIQEWLRNRKQTGGRVPRLYLKSCSITYGEITISD